MTADDRRRGLEGIRKTREIIARVPRPVNPFRHTRDDGFCPPCRGPCWLQTPVRRSA